MAESLKVSSALAANSSRCPSPFGPDDSAEDHYCDNLSKGAHFSSETSACDNTPTTQNFSCTDYHSANFPEISPDSTSRDDPHHVDLYPSFSTCGPNNRLEPHPLSLLRVSTSSDNSSVHQLPMGNVPAMSLPANCLPFSSVAAPQTRTDVAQTVDMRPNDCCDGRSVSCVYTTTPTLDAENGLAQSQQPVTSSLNTLEPRARDNTLAIPPTSGNAPDGHIAEAFPLTDSVLGLFIAQGRPQRGIQDGSLNVHRTGFSTAPANPVQQRASPSSLNVRVTVFPPTPHANSRPPSIRSRRVSADSIQLSPLDTVTLRYHSVSSEETDSLPALLSPSGSSASERDRPSTPATFVSEHSSYASSHLISEGSLSSHSDDRSRYIRPGTPIQTQLPDIELLPVDDATSDVSSHLGGSVGNNGNNLWLVSDDGSLHQGQFEIQIPQEEEDIIGDVGRAKELLEGLEKAAYELVRRYEKIRGDGHDICAICRELLIAPVQPAGIGDGVGHGSDSVDQPDTIWNLFASSALPFNNYNPSEEDNCSIHAFPCAHLFHTACLFPWLCIKTTCPTCRLDIDPHSLTLRVRGWSASRFPQFDGVGEPRYVNVDVLGRRIPWHRPPALSLEEWVSRRESENPTDEIVRGGKGECAHSSGDEKASEVGALPKSSLEESNYFSREQQQGVSSDEVCSLQLEDLAATPTDDSAPPDLSAIPLSISEIAGVEERHLGVGRIETDMAPRGSMNVRNGRTLRNMHVVQANGPQEDTLFTRPSLEFLDEERLLPSTSANTNF